MIKMKQWKIPLVTTSLLVIGIIVWISILASEGKEAFNSKKIAFEHMSESALIDAAMAQYFDIKGQYPSQYSLESLFKLGVDSTDIDTGELNYLRRTFLIDPMSDHEDLLGYVQIIENDSVCGFILLSSGIDGKMNNVQWQFSSMEEALENLKIYPENIFTIGDFLFGKRDIILMKQSYSK